MPTTTINLASIVHESEAAAQAAAQAQAKAIAAAQRAEAAKAEADREREAANVRFLAVLEKEHAALRASALDRQSEARTALETAATTGDGDVFTTYRDWAAATSDVWGVDAALSEQRLYLGRPGREATAPVFNFGHDIAAILDRHSLELQDVVAVRNRERRLRFLNGEAQQ
jgi:pyruvate/2-oxoglutarate dehydrogenase complex dihydrolipoamide acyltransferase (E2) component